MRLTYCRWFILRQEVLCRLYLYRVILLSWTTGEIRIESFPVPYKDWDFLLFVKLKRITLEYTTDMARQQLPASALRCRIVNFYDAAQRIMVISDAIWHLLWDVVFAIRRRNAMLRPRPYTQSYPFDTTYNIIASIIQITKSTTFYLI